MALQSFPHTVIMVSGQMCNLDAFQSCFLGLFFPWLLITARCGVCFRRIMFPHINQSTVQPWKPFYNCTWAWWLQSHSYVSMRTAHSETLGGKKKKNLDKLINLSFDLLKIVMCLVCLQDLLQEVKQLTSKVQDLEGEKSQYERKLRATKVHRVDSLCSHVDAHVTCGVFYHGHVQKKKQMSSLCWSQYDSEGKSAVGLILFHYIRSLSFITKEANTGWSKLQE